MKKLTMLALAAMMLFTTDAMAQFASQKGDISTEVKFNPFSDDFKTFSLEGLKVRYFVTDVDAVRLNVDFGMDKNTYTDKNSFNSQFDGATSYTIRNNETETKTTATTLKVGLGYERHLINDGRLNIYAGAEVGYIAKFYSAEQKFTETGTMVSTVAPGTTSTTNYTTSRTVTYEKMMPTGANPALPGDPTAAAPSLTGTRLNSNAIYAGIFTGVDFDIYKGIYVGTEFGIRFQTGKSSNNGTYTDSYSRNSTTNTAGAVSTSNTKWEYSSETGRCTGNTLTNVGGAITDTPLNFAYGANDYTASDTSVKVFIEPALRLGWRF